MKKLILSIFVITSSFSVYSMDWNGEQRGPVRGRVQYDESESEKESDATVGQGGKKIKIESYTTEASLNSFPQAPKIIAQSFMSKIFPNLQALQKHNPQIGNMRQH